VRDLVAGIIIGVGCTLITTGAFSAFAQETTTVIVPGSTPEHPLYVRVVFEEEVPSNWVLRGDHLMQGMLDALKSRIATDMVKETPSETPEGSNPDTTTNSEGGR